MSKKIQINEGSLKKGNTSPPPAQSRPAPPAAQGSASSPGSTQKGSSGTNK